MRGPVTITEVRNGHVELPSISGDVNLKAVTGPLVQVNSGSGKIVYDGDFGSGGDYKFTTHTGDILALVPPDVSADFRAHSVVGRVQNEFLSKRSILGFGRSGTFLLRHRGQGSIGSSATFFQW